MSKMNQILLTRTAPMIGHLSAYDNNLTAIIPDLYAGLDTVSRELVGFLPSVFRNSNVERAAVNQPVVYPIAPAPTRFNVTPAMTVPETTDVTVGSGNLTITKSAGYEFGWTGEGQRSVSASTGYLTLQADMFAQALRLLTNEMETDVATAAYKGASRALGTSGTTPFGSNFDEMADLRKVLDDNGAPATDRSLVINTTAGSNLRKKSQLTKVNEAGTTMTLRDGELLDIHGISIKESAGVAVHTKGTGALATTNAAGYAVGATVITLGAAGTGTVITGDVITFAGDTNQYVVLVGDTDVSGGGVITLAKPGLRQAIAASATAITVTNSYTGNIGFNRNAIHFITRAPALPDGGDSAIDSYMLTDPRSGISFEVRLYAVYRKIRAEVAAAWGQGVVKPEHVAILKG